MGVGAGEPPRLGPADDVAGAVGVTARKCSGVRERRLVSAGWPALPRPVEYGEAEEAASAQESPGARGSSVPLEASRVAEGEVRRVVALLLPLLVALVVVTLLFWAAGVAQVETEADASRKCAEAGRGDAGAGMEGEEGGTGEEDDGAEEAGATVEGAEEAEEEGMGVGLCGDVRAGELKKRAASPHHQGHNNSR